MKKVVLMILFVLFFAGCSRNNEEAIIEKISNKIEECQNYQLIAELEIYRNENKLSYDIVSTYKKDDTYKVELTNKKNNHKQIILKTNNFVYVLTPSLNKSFKFQSDWPNNNSQIYLIQPIILDLKNDSKLNLKKEKDYYLITSSVNYPNESNFKKQKVYINENFEIIKVEVVDSNDDIQMKLDVISIKYDQELSKNYFEPEQYKQENVFEEETTETTMLDDFVYPMYVPLNTYLSSQDVIKTEEGERVILTFSGESPFVFVQEQSVLNEEEKYIYGDPYLILDTVGSITNNSASWISGGVEYSIISDTISIDELMVIAQSIGVEPVGK